MKSRVKAYTNRCVTRDFRRVVINKYLIVPLILGVKELGATSTAWKKTDWGRSVYEKNVESIKKPLRLIEATFPVDSFNRQEMRGEVYSPDEEIHERITENVVRRRKEMDSSYEESQRIAEETSRWLEKTTTMGSLEGPPSDVKEPPLNWKCEYPIIEKPGSDAGRPPGQDVVEETRMTLTETVTRRHGELTVPRGTDPSLVPAMFQVAEAEDEVKKRTEATKMEGSNSTTTNTSSSNQGDY